MSVADLIQHSCQEKKNSFCIIKAGDRQIKIWFVKGEIAHAVSGNLEGEEAVYQALGWENGSFEVEAGVQPPERSIKDSWSNILLEGAKRLDEQRFDDENSSIHSAKKEHIMDIKKFGKVIDTLKEDLGDGLVATDIFSTKDGQSFSGMNSNPQACALFNEITKYLVKSLKGSNFPALGEYYMIHLEKNFAVVVVPRGDIQEGMLVDLNKATMGILTNVALPKVVAGLDEAMK